MKRKILLVCWYNPHQYSMIVNHIKNIQKKSRFLIDIFNVFNHTLEIKECLFFTKTNFKVLSAEMLLDISKYDGYIIHNTISYDIKNVYDLNTKFYPRLEDFSGFKVLMKQDEMFNTNSIFELVKNWCFDLLLTCIPESEWSRHFASLVSSSTRILHVLTGYVEDRMTKFTFCQYDYRPVDIFYRGMLLPYSFGKLAYEKYFIGEHFKKVSQKYNLLCNISSNIEDRLYNDDWFNALAESKAVLAVESGASIFDFDGSLKSNVDLYIKENRDASFDEVWTLILKEHEGKINYAQVSPRHFEAAATKTVQIMFEGHYSGIFEKDIHYLSLKKDFSNLDDLILKFRDIEFRNNMTKRAYNDVILNPKYSYNFFIKQLDENIEYL